MIYLDNAATTPMSPSSLHAYREVAEKYFGNPSSLHDSGSEAGGALESARQAIAGILGADPRAIHFSGSGSEANFLSVTSLAMAARSKGRHIITTPIEHSSLHNTFLWLEKQGFEVSYAGTDSNGRISPEALSEMLRDDTVLVSIQHVNSEIGVIQNLEAIGRLLKGRDIRFHSDLVQSFGKLPVNVKDMGLHAATISAHKIHGPKGVGAVYLDNSVNWEPFLPGVTQERGFRPGTVDVPAIVSFAVAAGDAVKGREESLEKVAGLKEQLATRLRTEMSGRVTIEGDSAHTSPYILGLTLSDMEGQHAMLECNRFGLAISTGSACQVNEQKPSATMIAIGKDRQEAQRLVRFSFSMLNTAGEVDEAFQIFRRVLEKHRATVTL